MDEPKDFRGTPIKVGSIIIYATTIGRSARLTEAEVLEVLPRSQFTRGSCRLHVQPIRDSYGRRWSGTRYDIETGRYAEDGVPKPVTLQHSDRLAVIA